MRRNPSSPICADCMKQHRRLLGNERLERRAALQAQLAMVEASETAYGYAEALYDHLSLMDKADRSGQTRSRKDEPYRGAPAIPKEWTAAQLVRADRLVLSTLHLWTKPKRSTAR